ncbi:MAG: ABC transporter ATP-binding protein, partial [Oscillospiraceae bacterium]|nr:ABC transporter ATP-binding protein [Oscillospiraceae bacterium]
KINMKKAEKDVQDIAKKYGFNVKYDSLISDITVGQQQKVEIIKALYRGADILILDEPTAVLTPQEIDELAIIIDNLKKEGKSVILITHKLKEIMKMSDRVTIIRRGKVIDSLYTKDVNIDMLAEMMVGRKVNLSTDKKEAHPKGEVLKVNYLNYVDKRGVKVIDDLSLSVKSGEILGIAGVDGNGQSELVGIIAGLLRATKGSVKIENNEIIEETSEDVVKLGFGHVPEDRQKRGLLLKFPLYENAVLGMHKDKKFSNGIILKYDKIKKHTKEIIKEFDVRTPNENVNAETLSGGNQQKLIVGREIFKDPKLLVVAQPTRGLDVGAIEYIHKRLIEERDKGTAILLVSFELDEILDLSDRIAVMYSGKIVSVMDRKDADEYKLGRLMAGGKA